MNLKLLFRKNYLLSFSLAFFISSTALAQKTSYASIREALFSGGNLSGSNGPASVNWIDEGERFSYTKDRVIRSFSPKEDKDELIFDTKGMKFPGTSNDFSYVSFQWSKDSKYLLFQCNFRAVWRNSGTSDYYFYSIENKSLKLVAKDARTAELSPDGKKVGYERDGNLFTYDFASQKETQLTNDAKAELYNGRYGWAYEEEFGLGQAWNWSNDSKYIAFWQSDEREVPVFQMTDYSGTHKEWINVRYPQVGDKNPSVRIGVVDVNSKDKKWMKVDLNDGYIPRIYWTAQEGKLAIVHLNRKQNHLKLYLSDVKTGESKVIMEEKSDAWINVFDFFAGINHLFFFPEELEEFFWISEKDGWSHIYRYDYTGKLLNQVTNGEWEVVIVHGVNTKKKTIYYSSTEDSPLERHLYSVRFDGKKKTKMTKTEGRHFINVSPNGDYYIDRYSNINLPTQVEIWSTKGKIMKKMEDNQSVKDYVEKHVYAPKELVSFTSPEGQKLDTYVIKPINFDPNKKYPLVLNIYGGPESQSVYNQFATNGWEQYLAQDGYVIVSVNNRGGGGYGAKFEKAVYENLGELEAKDFVATANYYASLPWVDGDNMAIRGHSYGGYISSYTTLKHPGVFKVAIVTAPVTDWRLYDSIYAERYMGLLPENKDKYVASAPTTYAGNLEGKMLLSHSTMDENVHVQNTFQLMKGLIDKGKDVDLRIYPPGAHGVAYDGNSYVLLYSLYINYLNQHLK